METYLVPMWVVECGVQRDGCISMVKAADAQATVEAVQRVRDEFERERDQLHAALMEAKTALDAEREKVAFVEKTAADFQALWRATCDQREAFETQLSQLQARVRDEFERERDQLHAALMEAKTALDAERAEIAKVRAEIAKVRATCDMLGKERNKADEAKYHAELKLTQLQALVRALPAVKGKFEVW